MDDNKKLSVENYRTLLYKASRSESKRETPNKNRKPNTTGATMPVSKSDKKIATVPGNNKTTDSQKPSSALLQSKSGGNILKVNKSGDLKNESLHQALKPLNKMNASVAVKYETVQHPYVHKPIGTKVMSPTNNSSMNVSVTQKPNLTSVNSGKIIKTILRKPEK